MNILIHSRPRVLAIDPFGLGFGYVVLEGPERLIDWGVRGKHGEAVQLVDELIDRYEPDVLVLEDVSAETRRSNRARRLLRSAAALARRRKISARWFPRSRVKKAFRQVKAVTKHEIATAIAEHLPILLLQLPPKRKTWMPEDYRMSIFDAAALAFTYFDFEERRRVAA